jgi:glutamate-5-semialdehyde dehydrogenase
VLELLQQDTLIDLVIPRGGEELIRWVVQSSRIPTIQHYKGVCHVYVDQHADEQMAERICVSAKTSAPATCNAAECILVHRAIADRLVPRLCESLALAGVQVRADGLALRIAEGAGLTGRASPVAASIDDFGREFLDLVVAMKVVASLDEAVAHIARYGSNHTEAIVTASAEAAADFQARVHASCVLHNASTRMNDGFALGLGAEIGISTSRLHAYGPMGLEELTTQRFVVDGDGHVR